MAFAWLLGLLLLASHPADAVAGLLSQAALDQGIAYRSQGQLELSIGSLRRACETAATEPERMRADAELGASLLQARRLDAAAESLRRAHGFYQGLDRARVALDLGILSALRGEREQARRHFDEALQLGAADPALRLAAGLNRAQLARPEARLAELDTLARQLAALPESADKARWQINLGAQYRLAGAEGLAPAHQHLSAGRRSAESAGESALLAEAFDGLAQLYEDQQRIDEALTLTRQGLATLVALPPGVAGERAIPLEWRLARLSRSQGRPAVSLAAYQRAVGQVERLRQDLPIDNDAGESSFRSTLEPIYLGLIEGLLDAADRLPEAQRGAHLRQVIDTVELQRQAELQDYLGDRCDVDAVKGGSATVIPTGTAVLYPIVLADRLELLVETSAGIGRVRSSVDGRLVRNTATEFAGSLRSGAAGFIGRARQLYDWVFRPLEPSFAAQRIDTVVVVPDGALRLVAMGAFHDGERYAIEKFAIATATGMSMTNTSTHLRRSGGLLLAGMAVPGPVVDKLDRADVARLLGPQMASQYGASVLVASRKVRAMRAGPQDEAAPAAVTDRSGALRKALSLPGVDEELAAIGRVAPGTLLQNEAFTVDAFRREAESGRYGIIHIASHGVFGGRADASYLMAYDELLTLDGLQSLLRSDAFRRRPIELLSLSACETAEGNERSPLGISGAAIRARAQAVMGSLWPVSDEAAVQLMERFYRALLGEGLSKAAALQRSQTALLRDKEFAHPFFWAPFIVIGNWQ